MYTVENNTSTLEDAVRVSSAAGTDIRQLTILCERLLCAQPQSESLLKRLLARSPAGNRRAFAHVQDGRCSACNMTVAIARIQQAKAGEFINCANCMTFLYYDPR